MKKLTSTALYVIHFPPNTVKPVIVITGAPQEPTTDATVDLIAKCIEGNKHPITFEWVDVANESVILGRGAKYTAKVSGTVTYRCTAKNAFGAGSVEAVVEEKPSEFLVSDAYLSAHFFILWLLIIVYELKLMHSCPRVSRHSCITALFLVSL